MTTFDGLAERILARTGGAPPALAPPVRALYLRRLAVRAAPPALGASARTPGFAAALGRLVDECAEAGIDPPALERELAAVGAPARACAVAELVSAWAREGVERGSLDRSARVAEAVRRVASQLGAWGAQPLLVYGFEELRPAQCALVEAIAARASATVALPFEPGRDTFAASAATFERLSARADEHVELAPRGYVERESLRALERGLHRGETARVADAPDGGVRLLEVAGAAGEARAVAAEAARALRAGVAPDELLIVLPSGDAAHGGARRGALGARRPVRPRHPDAAAADRDRPRDRGALPLHVARAAAATSCSPGSARLPPGSPGPRRRLGRARARAGPSRARRRRRLPARAGARPLAAVDQLRESDDPAAALCEILEARLAAAFGLDARVEPHSRLAARRSVRGAPAREVAGCALGSARAGDARPSSLRRSRLAASASATTARRGRVRVVGLRRARTHRVSMVIVLGLEAGRLPRRSAPRRAARTTACAASLAGHGAAARPPRSGGARPLPAVHRAHSARRQVMLVRRAVDDDGPPARGVALLERGPRGARRRRPAGRAPRAARAHLPARRRAVRARAPARRWPRSRARCCSPRAASRRRCPAGAPHRPGARRVRPVTRIDDPASARRVRGAARASARPSSRRSPTARRSWFVSACSSRARSTARSTPGSPVRPCTPPSSASSSGCRPRSARTASYPSCSSGAGAARARGRHAQSTRSRCRTGSLAVAELRARRCAAQLASFRAQRGRAVRTASSRATWRSRSIRSTSAASRSPGRIDRIDVDPMSARGLIHDYKSTNAESAADDRARSSGCSCRCTCSPCATGSGSSRSAGVYRGIKKGATRGLLREAERDGVEGFARRTTSTRTLSGHRRRGRRDARATRSPGSAAATSVTTRPAASVRPGATPTRSAGSGARDDADRAERRPAGSRRRAEAWCSSRPAPAAARRRCSSSAPRARSRTGSIPSRSSSSRSRNGRRPQLVERLRVRLQSVGLRRARRARPVSTIHGLCASILREHAFALGLDPEFRVLDEATAGIIRRRGARAGAHRRGERARRGHARPARGVRRRAPAPLIAAGARTAPLLRSRSGAPATAAGDLEGRARARGDGRVCDRALRRQRAEREQRTGGTARSVPARRDRRDAGRPRRLKLKTHPGRAAAYKERWRRRGCGPEVARRGIRLISPRPALRQGLRGSRSEGRARLRMTSS